MFFLPKINILASIPQVDMFFGNDACQPKQQITDIMCFNLQEIAVPTSWIGWYLFQNTRANWYVHLNVNFLNIASI